MSEHDKKCPHCKRVLTNGDTAANCYGQCLYCRRIVYWCSKTKQWVKDSLYPAAGKAEGEALVLRGYKVQPDEDSERLRTEGE